MLYQLSYLSSAINLFSSEQLKELLEQSRKKNSMKNITGALFYNDGNFLQIIEGEKKLILQLFETIKKDERHKDVIVLFEEEIETREFRKWSMAYKNLNDKAVHLPDAYSDILSKPYSQELFETYPEKIRGFISLFHSENMFTNV